MGHVTGRYIFADLATVTSSNGIVAKIYGPWHRTEHGGSLLFINPASKSHRELITAVEDGVLEQINPNPHKRLLVDKIEHNILGKEKVSSLAMGAGQKEAGQKKESSLEVFLNKVGKSMELETLKFTLNRHS